MVQTPSVSIVIPTFNTEKYAAEAIESALNQTYGNVEIVVVDDGSTDGTPDVIRSFGDRIRYEIGPNRGACAARNRGLELSRGEYIQFLDADDALLPEKIELQVAFILEHNLDSSLCQGLIVDALGHPLTQGKPYVIGPDTDLFLHFLDYSYQTSLPLHSRRLLEKVGAFRVGLPRGQEFDLHLRLAAAGMRARTLPERLAKLRLHPEQTMSQRKWPADQHLSLLMTLAEEFGEAGSLTQEQANALASKIHLASIYAFRGGARRTAAIGFRVATRMAVAYDYPERSWVKQLARLTSPQLTEYFLLSARSVFRPQKAA